MRTVTVPYSSLSNERSMRCDTAYQAYQVSSGSLGREYYLLGEIADVCVPEPIKIDTLDGGFKYCQIGDVDKFGNTTPVDLNFSERDVQNEDYYKKIEKGDIISVQEGDILMSFLIPADFTNGGKFVRISNLTSKYYFTSAFLQLRPKASSAVVYYCLRSVFYSDIANVSRIRKGYTGYATISADDLRNARLDKGMVDKLIAEADRLTNRIAEIENRILAVECNLRTPQAIIDDVFTKEFKLDYAEFEKLKTHKRFFSSLSAFSNNPDLRFSTKFHRDAGAFVMGQLSAITNNKVKHYLAEPIVLGASVSPDDYTDEGDVYYISMATIKSWAFDSQNANLLKPAYVRGKQDKTVRKNDILLARSGEGTIGKVALIDDEDIQGVFADFTMRIRLTNYNPLFAYYYFRTKYFQYLVEIYKKGLGNNTNIFPIVIREFPIPDISLEEQQDIVDKIQKEIDKQNSIKSQITDLRGQIDLILEDALV